MAYATFQYWYKRFRSAAEPQPLNDFVPLMIDTAPSSHWCELIGAGGKRLMFHQPVSADFLRELMS